MGRSLKDRAKEFSTVLPFMEGRDKANFQELIDRTVIITDYGFLKDTPDKQYVAFVIKEDDKHFYFGGQVLTDQISQLDKEGFGAEIRRDGLPAKFAEKKAKKPNEQGRYNIYTSVEFYPEEKPAADKPAADKPKK
jgi:hypothetical protein